MKLRLRHTKLAAAALAVITSIVAVGGPAARADAAQGDSRGLQATALYSAAGAVLLLRVGGAASPAVLEELQVKARTPGAIETGSWNFNVALAQPGRTRSTRP